MAGPEAGLLECVVNVSEGRDKKAISEMARVAGPVLLDVHSDAHHHRSVLTLAGPTDVVTESARAVATAAASIDLPGHSGVHPRFGALDVVPFVDLVREPHHGGRVADGCLGRAVEARDAFARWAARHLGLPCFLYGPERTLPEVRRGAWSSLRPDIGPSGPHPSAGAVAVGARPVLVAYNLWLAGNDLEQGRRLAASIRSPHVRALGLAVGARVQVSCNLIAPWRVGPGAVFDAVASQVAVEQSELVGLVPLSVLEAEPQHRWGELGLSPSATIEARLEQAGLNGGRFRDPGR